MLQYDALDLATKAAKGAGEYLAKKKDVHIDSAEGKDLKLSSDKESERIIIKILAASGLPILSEESGCDGDLGEKYWIVDPLDGSMNYYRDIDELCCVSIALWDKGKPVLGVVNRFMKGELFTGDICSGAHLNGLPIATSPVIQIGDAMLATGFPVKRNYEKGSLENFIKNIQRFKKIRMLGTAAISGAFVACGYLDAYFEEEIMLWDIAGAAAIVNAAGGVSEIELLNDYKCNCRLFATNRLMEDFHAQSL